MTRFSRVEDLRVSIFMLFFVVNLNVCQFAIRCPVTSPGPIEVDLQDFRKFLEHGLMHHRPNVAPPTESRSKVFFAQAHGPVNCESSSGTHRSLCPQRTPMNKKDGIHQSR